MKVDHYFDRLDSTTKDIAVTLRQLTLASLPGAQEEIKWSVPVYSIRKNICSIMVHKKHVNLQIFQGAHIEDSHRLEGTGKDMRHLKFHALDEIEKDVIEQCLKQAAKLAK